MNEKGFLYWIKKKIDALLIFLHLKKKEEAEKKKKEEEIARRMSKPEIISKFFLGFFFGIIEYATSRPKKEVKELVDIDAIEEQIKNLEKKIEWLEKKVLKERRHEKKEAYQKKLDHTKDTVKTLEKRRDTILENQKHAEAVKAKLDHIMMQLEDIENEIHQIKSNIVVTKEIPKLEFYQKELEKKEIKLKDTVQELEQIQEDYDRFANVELPVIEKGEPTNEDNVQVTTKALPLTEYLEEEVITGIVLANKKALSLTKEIEKETLEAKDLAHKKEEEEKERIRREEEERLQQAVNEVKMAEERINSHVQETNDEIEKLRKQVDKVKKVTTKQKTLFRGVSKMVVNVSKMAVGLLSFSFFKNPGVGLLVGSVILNNSIRGMRNAVRLNKRRITYYKYTDVTHEIIKQRSTLKVNQKLMSDSLKQIAAFRNEFETKFEDHIKDLPEFKELLDKVDMVERELLVRSEELNQQKKKLNEVEKKNEKQKRKEKNNNFTTYC